MEKTLPAESMRMYRKLRSVQGAEIGWFDDKLWTACVKMAQINLGIER